LAPKDQQVRAEAVVVAGLIIPNSTHRYLRGLLLLSAVCPLAAVNASPRAAFVGRLVLPTFGRPGPTSRAQSNRITMAAQRLVLWFRNDLRLHDNYIIAEAAKKLSSNRKLEVSPFPGQRDTSQTMGTCSARKHEPRTLAVLMQRMCSHPMVMVPLDYMRGTLYARTVSADAMLK